MRKRNTEQLKDVLQQVLRQSKLDKPLLEKRLIDAWPKVLGENISKYTSNISIKNRVLYVVLTSSVLRHDLFLSKEQIIKSLNAQVGKDVIKDIMFR